MTDEDDTDARSDPARPSVPLICAECDGGIDRTEWHPVVTETDDDGTFHVHAFCSEACRDAWDDRDD